ncbi:MAG: helicase, partial [Candidatus Lokiarchaeota archaeon]|nr:helicase [Candidatus Lokiarchaeota archaeon]
MKTKEEDARDIIQTRITKGLLGPGSDIWGNPDTEEIISDYPLQRYFTGIIFPRKDIVRTEDEEDSANIEIETDDLDNDGLDLNTLDKEENIPTESESENLSDDDKNKEEIKIDHNNFYPTNMGLTFCVDRKVKTIEADFNFGLYFQPKYDEIKIAVSADIFQAFLNNDAFPFKDLLIFDDDFLSLKRPLEGYKGGRSKERSGEYILYDEFRNSDALKNDQILNSNFHLFEKLISRTWKRKDIKRQVELELSNSKGIIYEDEINKNNKISIHYYITTYELDNKKHIKIQIANHSTPQPKNRFSNKNEILNRKCIFQTELKISSNHIKPYKSYYELNPFDDESQILNHLYRDVQDFCIGHNTSAMWDNKNEYPRWIKTTFLPEYDIKELKNDFTEKDFSNHEQQKIFDTILDLKNLSHFGLEQSEILTYLNSFVDYYEEWIDEQKEINQEFQENKISKKLILNLEYNYNRLKDNIKYLEDEKIFRCFQLANTAMYIQLIISSDENFSKKEKYLSELSSEIPYNDIEYFINHSYIQPKYRPFQLAFFLLNLDGIVNLNSKSRNEIVDLLWFPTGGGKTEAYLALAAFTIIWRRMNNLENYDGTSVIMRYTLRLLTAQQFERASRLIVSLEFLRNHFQQEMKDSPITIGLWVGMASTPNVIE